MTRLVNKPALPSDLRNRLERTVVAARDAAEASARAALEALAVQHDEPYPLMNLDRRALRIKLRAQLCDDKTVVEDRPGAVTRASIYRRRGWHEARP